MPPAGPYDVSLVSRAECAPGVGTFRFSRPEGYLFVPGQYLTLMLETREGPQAKPFSHADAPGDPAIEIATRMTGSAFKDALEALPVGASARVDGPKGGLRVPEGATRVAFLVGGVGITPARSIIRDADQRDTRIEMALFYGNRDESCVPYRDELEAVAARRSEVMLVEVVQEPSSEWGGERGFITADVVRRHIDPGDGWHFVVVGPPPMIEPMRAVLGDLGVEPDRRTIETFTGYV